MGVGRPLRVWRPALSPAGGGGRLGLLLRDERVLTALLGLLIQPNDGALAFAVELGFHGALRSEGVTDRAIDVVGQAIDEGNVGTALAWLRMTLTPSWSMPRNGTSSLKPLTATEIIAHAAELVAMHEPMQALTAIYRQEAIDQIHEALATSD